MSTLPAAQGSPVVVYPDSDGEPMSDNTEQFDLITLLKWNIDALVPDFVGGDLLWYPVEGDPKTRAAPDVLVAFGRPKGRRGSYRTWDEGGVVPQVVVEIWSPRNRFPDRVAKYVFYNRHGVEEFISYDPDTHELAAWVRRGADLEPVSTEGGWTSPRLGVTFSVVDGELVAVGPDGRRFADHGEDRAGRIEAEARAEAAAKRAEAEAQRAEAEAQRADAEAKRAAALAEMLRKLGVDPG